MSAFTGPLTIEEFHVDSDLWRLVTALTWQTETLAVVVPIGFISDGASMPFPFWFVFPRWGKRYRRPAILHDFLIRAIDQGVPDPAAPNRRAADRIFLAAMKACGVSLPVRALFYAAVALFTLIGAPRWLNPSQV